MDKLCPRTGERAILVGDLNVAPLSTTCGATSRCSSDLEHAGRDAEARRSQGGNSVDIARELTPEPAKLYTW